jgi:hybrid polyketide synthase / nonribosomal peptide synthetase ACE1
MVFQVLDIEKDPQDQGFSELSFDVIIASFVLHATRKLEETLRNVRRLLKPGGFLLMLEVTNLEQARLGFIFGSLPGWWLGSDDNRSLSPCVTTRQWDALLRKTGFSGIDSITPDLDPLPFPASAFVAQAVDSRVNFLRNPLSSSYEAFLSRPAIQRLLLVGGNTLTTSKLISSISELLKGHLCETTCIGSLNESIPGTVPQSATVVNLLELEEPTFQSMTSNTLAGLKTLFGNARNILWITQGSRAEHPYQNESVGFGRSMLVEMPHVRSQFLDLDSIDDSSAKIVAEALLRFALFDPFEQPALEVSLLWSTEPEIAIERGKEVIPRIMLNTEQNNRYNSSRRLITVGTDRDAYELYVAKNGSHFSIQQSLFGSHGVNLKGSQPIRIDVSHSVLTSIRISTGAYVFLVAGTISKTRAQVVAFSESNASYVEVPHSWCVSSSEQQVSQTLFATYLNLFALLIVSGLSEGERLLVLEPDPTTAAFLAYHAAKSKINIAFLTAAAEPADSSWTSIREHSTLRELRDVLPRNTSIFFNAHGHESLASRIMLCLPPTSRVDSMASMVGAESSMSTSISLSKVRTLLIAAASWPNGVVRQIRHGNVPMVALKDVSLIPVSSRKPQIIDWRESTSAMVTVKPVDHKPMLSSDKTYWLVGLTGSLGISLCRWMIVHGARFIVFTSRNPSIEKAVMDELHNTGTGVTIKVIAGDVTVPQSIKGVFDEICSTLPPIAGVAQGAMVLRDTLIADMDIHAMQSVLKPKVDGSRNLDVLFPDPTLDFFIFFSSSTCVTGNMGQSNYAAANMFMISLAAQRRSRGLAGSVINIGAILGVGYVTRETSQALQNNLLKSGHVWMSEEDFHTIFAEAILAGSPKSKRNPEIITGLRVINTNDEQRPLWSFNPKFQHLVIETDLVARQGSGLGREDPLRSRLLVASSREQVQEILQGK